MRLLAIATLLCACGGSRQPPATAATAETEDLDVEPRPETANLESETPPATVAPPTTPSPRRARARSPERRVWRGRRIDLDVRDADLTNLYRFLAEVGGINIVIAPDVRGRVTLRLKAVPWDQIADVVARANALEIERDGRLWLVRKRAD